jgi:hypothetical protein
MKKFAEPRDVLGVVPVPLAMPGSAVAGSQITGAEIKDATTTGKDINNHSVGASKLTGHAWATLQGERSAAGLQLAAGPAGTIMPCLLRVLSLALTLFLFGAAGARAADTLSISYGADPTEEVFTPVTATWSSAESNLRVIVTRKAGSRGCGRTYAADDAYSTDVINRVVGSSGSASQNWRLNDPGTVTLCGYLYRANAPGLLAATGPVPLTYRPGRASVAIEVPPRVSPGQIFRFFVPVSAELRRHLEVTLKPTGSRGCGANYPLDDPVSTDLIYGYMQGNHRYAKSIRAPAANGMYLLCAYVSERPTDPAPEATFAATFEVGPNLCAEARAKLASANRTATSAQSSVTSYRRSYKRYQRRASRTHGASHETYRRLAKRDRSRYESAVRRRDAARAAAASAQAEVTAACGGK